MSAPPCFPRFKIVQPFALATMASADFSQFITLSLTWLLFIITPVRPPRVRAITFLPCNCCIYCMELVQYRTLFCIANSSIPIQPCIQFLFVSSGFCLRLLSDSVSRRTPLPSANSSYCQVCSGLPPPSYSPCRAHNQNHQCELVVCSAAESLCYRPRP